jgi:hypothetical protein
MAHELSKPSCPCPLCAYRIVDQGGDWERRNRLKVYEAAYLLSEREFKRAAELLLESLATFTCLELMPYKTYIFYTVVAAVVALDRVTLKKKVRAFPALRRMMMMTMMVRADAMSMWAPCFHTRLATMPSYLLVLTGAARSRDLIRDR